ncbi:MAG TPA: hypothetical protein DEB39_09360 [Planctomycetaceae bacterium]|nr:hypothetical protein [Planctomycetaceae bacterium]
MFVFTRIVRATGAYARDCAREDYQAVYGIKSRSLRAVALPACINSVNTARVEFPSAFLAGCYVRR